MFFIYFYFFRYVLFLGRILEVVNPGIEYMCTEVSFYREDYTQIIIWAQAGFQCDSDVERRQFRYLCNRMNLKAQEKKKNGIFRNLTKFS